MVALAQPEPRRRGRPRKRQSFFLTVAQAAELLQLPEAAIVARLEFDQMNRPHGRFLFFPRARQSGNTWEIHSEDVATYTGPELRPLLLVSECCRVLRVTRQRFQAAVSAGLIRRVFLFFAASTGARPNWHDCRIPASELDRLTREGRWP